MNETEHRKRERSLFAVLLLFGIGILFCVGQLAIGIAPNWEVAANMRSNLDPNSDFLTRKNSGIVGPLNPDILTLPAWLYLFTPNAILPTNAGITPPVTRAATRVPTKVPTQPATLPPTIVYTFPVTTPTKKSPLPVSTSTPTNIPLIPSADLAIAKTDSSATYTPGSGISYQIVVTNGGPNNASGFSVTDTVPAVINITSVSCVSSGTANCGANGTIGNIVSYTGVSANAGAGNQITITIAGTVNVGATGNLDNTAIIVIPGGAIFGDPNTGNNTATDTDTPPLSVDLGIAKDDGVATYTPGGTLTYTIVVTNPSTFTVNDVTVTDTFPSQISSASWTCVGTGLATCTASGSSDINDTVNVPAGSNVTYMVTANVSTYAVGTLANTASVAAPAGFIDTNLINNRATDPDTCTTSEPGIGPPDKTSFNPGPGGSITILFSPGIVASGDVNTPDFVYYEVLSPPPPSPPQTIDMDWVKIEISSDNISWYTVFFWGDGNPDEYSNLDINIIGGTEDDNRKINTSDLYPVPGTGVTIDIDHIPGIGLGISYPWMRISGPSGGADGPDIDAIQPYYP